MNTFKQLQSVAIQSPETRRAARPDVWKRTDILEAVTSPTLISSPPFGISEVQDHPVLF